MTDNIRAATLLALLRSAEPFHVPAVIIIGGWEKRGRTLRGLYRYRAHRSRIVADEDGNGVPYLRLIVGPAVGPHRAKQQLAWQDAEKYAKRHGRILLEYGPAEHPPTVNRALNWLATFRTTPAKKKRKPRKKERS